LQQSLLTNGYALGMAESCLVGKEHVILHSYTDLPPILKCKVVYLLIHTVELEVTFFL